MVSLVGALVVFLLVVVLISILVLVKFGLLELILHCKNCNWYDSVLCRVQPGQRLLDVGSGSASALASKGEVILNRNLVVVCIDPFARHVKQAHEAIHGMGLLRRNLKHKLILHHKSIYDVRLQSLFTGDAGFHAVCCSSPIMGFSDPADVLRIAASVLKEGGLIYVPHIAAPHQGSLEALVLRLFNRGPTANARDFRDIAAEAGMEVLDDLPAFGADGKKPVSARLLVLRQNSAAARSFAIGKEAKGEGAIRSRKSVEARL